MKILRYGIITAAICAQSAAACDLCAIYSASEARGEIGKGPFVGVSEQFTVFGTLQEDGREIDNHHDEVLNSSITQLVIGYNFNDRFGVQFNAPLIDRAFRRVGEDETIENGSESGLGDVSLLAHFQAYRHDSRNGTFAWTVLGGVKFPTGGTRRLKEETEEEEGGHESGIHGHDLALGSGSYDGIIGTSAYYRWKRAFFSASVQYAIRSRGEFGYQYANDLVWAAGPGVLLMLSEEFTLSFQANVSGETKGRDNLNGEKADDTGITSVFLGPQFDLTWRDKLSAELAFDVPMSIDNTAVQLVPDYRFRVALLWHF